MTTARTRAAKIKAKRGRPPKVGAIRTESGRISRSEKGQCMTRIELEAATWKRRQMIPDLTPEEARKPEHGSVIERWHEDYKRIKKRYPDGNHPNEFTQIHYDTAIRYHECYDAWLSAIEAKRQRSGSDYSGVRGYDGRDPFDRDAQRKHIVAERAFKDARRVIMEAGPLCPMAVEAIIIENHAVESLRGDLRMALNRLAILWRLQSAA